MPSTLAVANTVFSLGCLAVAGAIAIVGQAGCKTAEHDPCDQVYVSESKTVVLTEADLCARRPPASVTATWDDYVSFEDCASICGSDTFDRCVVSLVATGAYNKAIERSRADGGTPDADAGAEACPSGFVDGGEVPVFCTAFESNPDYSPSESCEAQPAG